MKGVFVGISNGIYRFKDSNPADKTVIKKDITKPQHKQGPFFSPVLYIFSFPAFCGFNEIGRSHTILVSFKVIGINPPLPATEDTSLFVENPPQVDRLALSDLFTIPDGGCERGIFHSFLNAVCYIHDMFLSVEGNKKYSIYIVSHHR